MPEARVLARDRRTGKLVLFHELADGSFVVETQYGLDDIIGHAADLRSVQPSGWKGDVHLVASIPMPLHQQLRAKGIVQDKRDFHKWLNDPDHAKLRTKTGKL